MAATSDFEKKESGSRSIGKIAYQLSRELAFIQPQSTRIGAGVRHPVEIETAQKPSVIAFHRRNEDPVQEPPGSPTKVAQPVDRPPDAKALHSQERFNEGFHLANRTDGMGAPGREASRGKRTLSIVSIICATLDSL